MSRSRLRDTDAGPRAHPAPVRVHVADRQPLFRDALVRAVRQRPTLQLVGETAEGWTTLDAIRERRPDVALVDVRLDGLDGRRILNAVVRDALATRVLLLTATPDACAGYEAIAAGASGWVSKGAEASELCNAIETVADGGVMLTQEVQAAIAAEIRRRATLGGPLITDRERRMLLLVADGRSSPEIADDLHLSIGTVKASLVKLYKRFGVSERAAAVALAMRRGLIQ